MSTLEIIITIILALSGFFAISWMAVSRFASKFAGWMGTAETTLDSAAIIAEGLGLEKVAMVLKEGADIPEEAEKLAEFIAEITADENFTKDEAMAAIQKAKDGLWVELKDFRMKVFPKEIE